ncbi:MAG: mechanosensitive ion channel [Candidatus Saccharibacteria bacterium]|nr:mechanosensitive ion channel [Candidatus Saccharibacteria bacterium]
MFIYEFRQAIHWISAHILPIAAIIVFAIVSIYIGQLIIKASVRRLVHGRHFARANQSIMDVKKRQDTVIGVSVILWNLIVIFGAGLALFTTVFPEINLVPLLASAGVIGAIIGFGAQSIIRDFISGAFIIIENQFRIGDEVEVDGAIGKVEHITLRSTVIRDDAGNVHYIANGNVFHTINKTMGYSKIYFTLSVSPETDIDELKSVIEKVGQTLAKDEKWQKTIIEPPTLLNLGAFSDQALEVRVSGKTQPGEQFALTTEFKKRLLIEIKKRSDIKLSQYQDLSSLSKKK